MYDIPIETRYGSVKKRSGNIDTVGNWVRVRYRRKTPTRTGDFDLDPTEVVQIKKPVLPILRPRGDEQTGLPTPKKSSDKKAGEIWKNSLGMEFVQIPAGNFKMGSNLEDEEKPVHNVTLTKDFQMGKYEVTQSQWRAVMGTFPPRCDYPYELFTGNNLPIICVTYAEIEDFIRRMNGRKEGIYRLPTEAEWEYAARAGNVNDVISDLDSAAWIDENSGNRLHPVGQKQPNAFGLYDIYGNVWEWCQDYYDNFYYRRSPKVNPLKSNGYTRVTRGGSWQNPRKFARPAARGVGAQLDSRLNWVGFRLVRQPY